MTEKAIVHFIFELGLMKRVRHQGWKVIGIRDPESIAEHSLRAAQIGFFLARMEKEDPYRVLAMVVFHDIGECRTGDVHKIACRYVTSDEERAMKDQTEKLGAAGKAIRELWTAMEHRKTRAGVIAKDADLLEQAFTAKEFMEAGYKAAQDWIDNVARNLKTASGKKLLKTLTKMSPNDWWEGLKK